MHFNRRQILGAAAAAPWAMGLSPARASSWPNQPFKMHIGYSTGGAADLVARALSTRMEQLLGQPVVFEYRPGAGGAIAAGFVARQASDGYNLYLADTGSMSIIPNLRPVPYDPVKDFTPLGYVGASGLVVLVNPKLPVNDIPGLIRLLKDKPDEYAYSSSGIGSPHQLAGELFKQMTGTQMRHVPYRGAAPAMNDLMAGQVQIAFATVAPALPLIQGGRVRAIGVTSQARVGSLKDVPTIAEQGVVGYDATPWFAMVGPANLPAPIAQRLQQTMAQTMADPAVVAILERNGLDGMAPRTPDQLTAIIRADLSKWGGVIKTAGIKLEG
jgi:tripartite-type tricarboxylate transporter receptor subunit TctC